MTTTIAVIRSDSPIGIIRAHQQVSLIAAQTGPRGEPGPAGVFVGPSAPPTTDVVWIDTDEAPVIAAEIPFNPTGTDLVATNVQAALVELWSRL
jgi:hypothetical protein